MTNARGKKRAEYQAAYNAKPENVAKRVKNNQARREAIKEGKARVGDGKDVDHIRMQDQGGGNEKENLRVVDEKKNRGWRKDHPEAYGNNGKGKGKK